MNTGDVVTSGAPGGELLVTGDAVNVAARLQQAAEPGAILVGERTARAARSHFDVRSLDEPLEAKGKSAPVAAWIVEDERADAEPRGVPGLAAPLVGRDDELASIEAAFKRVSREGRPELVTLLGDAGIGKSRLLREFLSSLDVEVKVLVGRCLPYGEGVTLWPLAEMLKAEAVVLDTDPAEAALAKIADLVETTMDRDLVEAPESTAAALASTLGLRPADDPAASRDPRELYRELVAAWLALFASLGRRGPVAAVVEDLHWADPTMLDVLDEVAERLEGPVLFLCSARPDLLRSRPGWGGGRRNFSSLPLDPLSGDEGERLVSLLLDIDALSAGVRRRILVRSEGNPFFLEEIVRRLIDDGSIVRDDGVWRARDGIEDVEIPDSVQAVILARLDLLSPEERRVAQRAAVVGRVFWDGAVARTARVDGLEAALRMLRRREFVVERLSSSIAGQREFTFKHVLVRDVAYESLPRRERGRAHVDTAAWIEETSGDRTAEVAELLAHHYDAAHSYLADDGVRCKARAQLLVAAENAHRRFAIEQGERFERRTVELSAPGAERVEALEALGDLHYLANNGDAAWQAYRDALAELPDRGRAFARLAGKAALFAARWIGTMHDLPATEEVGRLIEDGLAAAPEAAPERTLLLVDRGFLVTQRGDLPDSEVAEAVREAEAAAVQLGDPDLLSAALDLVQSYGMGHGRYGDMYRTALRRSALVPRMTDVKEIGDSHAMAAWSSFHRGLYAEADAQASACIERARGVDAGSYLHGLTWRVAARFMLGDWDAALADQTELERVAALDPREVPAGYTMRAYSYAALCHEHRGEHERTDRYVALWRRYLERTRRTAELRTRGSLQAPPLARLLASRERFDEALALIPLVPASGSAGVTLEALCEITAARQRWEEAPFLVRAARDEAELGELRALPAFADRLEGRAAAAAGERTQATELLRRSGEVFRHLSARWEEAWSRLLLAEVLADGDAAAARQEVARALPVFESLRSLRELERARSLLAQVTA